MKHKIIRRGATAVALVSLAGLAANSYPKSLDPLGADKFEAFVLLTTASTSYDGPGQGQCTITGDVFEVVRPEPGWLAGASTTS